MRPLIDETIAMVIFEPICFNIRVLVHGRIAMVSPDQFGSHGTIVVVTFESIWFNIRALVHERIAMVVWDQFGTEYDHCNGHIRTNLFQHNYEYWYMGESQWSHRTNLVHMRPLVDGTIVVVTFGPIWFNIRALVHGRIVKVVLNQIRSGATIGRWDHLNGRISTNLVQHTTISTWKNCNGRIGPIWFTCDHLVNETFAMVIFEPIWFNIPPLVHGRIVMVVSDQFGSHATIW